MNQTALLKRGLLLEYLTLGWNVVGVMLVILAAYVARSVALAGFGSPTRLVRFGLAGAVTVSGSIGIDGALPFDATCASTESWVSPVVFFLRLRVGFGATSVVGSDAWATLAGSCSGGVASTFLRDRDFLTDRACSASERGATSPDAVDPLLISGVTGAGAGEPDGSDPVELRGRGWDGSNQLTALQDPPQMLSIAFCVF